MSAKILTSGISTVWNNSSAATSANRGPNTCRNWKVMSASSQAYSVMDSTGKSAIDFWALPAFPIKSVMGIVA